MFLFLGIMKGISVELKLYLNCALFSGYLIYFSDGMKTENGDFSRHVFILQKLTCIPVYVFFLLNVHML